MDGLFGPISIPIRGDAAGSVETNDTESESNPVTQQTKNTSDTPETKEASRRRTSDEGREFTRRRTRNENGS